MSFVFPTSASQVQAFAGALYGVQVGSATMAQVNADILANGGLTKTLNGYYSATFGGLSTASVGNTVAANLGLTGAALTSGSAYIAAQLNAVAADARGAVISNIVNLFSTLASDATFGAAATAWNTKVAAAVAYTGATNVAIGSAAATSQSFNLTSDVNEIAGGSGTDLIKGIFDVGGGTATTYDAADLIDGGDGVDTLALTLVDSDAAVVNDEEVASPVATGLEILSITNSTRAGETTTLDVANLGGLTTVNLVNAGDNRATIVTGLEAMVDASIAGSGSLTLEYDTEVVAPTNNVQKVSLNGTKEGTNETNIFTADGVETIALTAKSASDIQIGGDAITRINVDGSAAFTVTDRAIATLKTIDASAATGAASINAIGAAVTLVKGGAGNDQIYVHREMSKDVVVDGGAGNDALFITNTNITSTTLGGVTNVETIGLASDADTTVDVSAAKGLNAIVATLTNDDQEVEDAESAIDALNGGGMSAAELLTFVEDTVANSGNNGRDYGRTMNTVAGGGTDRGTGTLDVTNLASSSTVTLSSLGLSAVFEDNPALFDLLGQENVELSVKGASKVDSATDTLNIVVNHNSAYTIKNTALGAVSAGKNLYVIDEIKVDDVETITINSQGTFAGSQIANLAIADASTLTLTGSNALTIGSATTAGLDMSGDASASLDASAMTGRLSVTVSSAEFAQFDGGFVGAAGSADGLTVTTANDFDISTATKGFETITVRVGANHGGSVDFSEFAGATRTTLRLSADSDNSAENVEVSGIASGGTLFLTNTQGAGDDTLTIVGAGSSSSLRLVTNEDLKTSTAWATGELILERLGSLTIDTTRVDGTDSDTEVNQQDTAMGGVTSATLKSLTVLGANADSGDLDLGTVDAALLTSLDLSGFTGAVGFSLVGSTKGVTVKLNAESAADFALSTDGPSLIGSDVVVFDSNIKNDVTISNFKGAVGATISDKADKLDLSALGVSLSDLTFTDVDTDNDQVDDTVEIEIDGIDGIVTLTGVTEADLSATNFIF
jgi:hypothetical protein